MKHNKFHLYIAASAIALMVLNGCSKDFLDEPRPTQSVTEKDVFKTASSVRAYFNGIYSKMRQPWYPIGAADFNSTDNWGYVSINLTRVNNGIDMINTGGWYQFDYRHENREPSYRRTIFTWQFFYETINQANILIHGLEQTTTIPADEKTGLIAEARALRGWFYFEAIREFQFTYAKDPNAPGIPIYTEPTSVENKGKPRGTVKDVYDQINSDMAFAVANIGTARLYKSQIILPVVQGFVARIMLEQERWAEAAEAAVSAREGFALDPLNYSNGYGDMQASPEVIWGFPQNFELGPAQTLYYGTPSSFYDKTGAGYDNFYFATGLVESFSATDVRNTFFVTSGTANSMRRYSSNKFGKPTNDDIELITGEIVKLKTTNFDEDMPMMRVAEMILIEAEAIARLGMEAEAQDLLYELQRNRDPAALQSTSTGQALIEEILLERRKELYGELGIDFLDIKRLQLPLDREDNHPPTYQFHFEPNSKEFILRLPQRELDTNDAISEADQNE